MFTLANLITWIVVGLIGGTLAGRVTTRSKVGYGLFTNLALGCIGAIVGGGLFELLGIWPNLDKISISVRDLLAAFVGSVIVLAAVWAFQRNKLKQLA
jgi:uncharacterized membrane protein YeaQ/YmgE (transglycosylase-associated protein family)